METNTTKITKTKTTRKSTTNTGMKSDDSKRTNDRSATANDSELDGLSQDEFSDPLSSGDEADLELDSTLIDLGAIITNSQNTVKVSEDTVVTVTSEPMDVESETTNPGPSTSANAAQNIIQTNTDGIDGNEQVYVHITNRERKALRKKWRNFIHTTKASSSRDDYVKWIKNEIESMKSKPQPVNSAVQQRVQQKRIRSDDSTPKKTEHNKRRREGTNAPTRYNEIVASTNMVIVQNDYPKSVIDADQAELIKNNLLTALDKETVLAPNFREIRHSGGALHVACLDDESKRWIEKVVPTIQPWEAALLKAIPKEELVKYVKAVVYIPYSDLPKETILRRLAIQNRGLNTSIWRFVRMKEEKVGQTMVVLMDEESAEFIKNKNLTVGLNFTQVKFRFPKRNEDPVTMEDGEQPGTNQEGTSAASAETVTASGPMFPPLPPPAQPLQPIASTSQAVPKNPVVSSQPQMKPQRATSKTGTTTTPTRSSREGHGDTPERNRDRYSSSRHRRREHSRDRRDSKRDDRSQSSRRSSSSRHRSESPERRKSQGRQNPQGK